MRKIIDRPRIKWIVRASLWKCEGLGCTGLSSTVNGAYRNWLDEAKRAK